MARLYETLNQMFDSRLDGYLTEYALDTIEKVMCEMVKKKIDEKKLDTLEDFIKEKCDEDKLIKMGENLIRVMSLSQIGSIFPPRDQRTIHPLIYGQAVSGARLLCGFDYWLSQHDYNLDKTHDNTCGTRFRVIDNGLIDYIQDIK